jgi:hypothetical protein
MSAMRLLKWVGQAAVLVVVGLLLASAFVLGISFLAQSCAGM